MLLPFVNAFAGLVLGFMLGAALTDAVCRVVPAGALRAGPATAAGVMAIWVSALLGAGAGWHW